jgi:hypothetical protein
MDGVAWGGAVGIEARGATDPCQLAGAAVSAVAGTDTGAGAVGCRSVGIVRKRADSRWLEGMAWAGG